MPYKNKEDKKLWYFKNRERLSKKNKEYYLNNFEKISKAVVFK